MELPHSKVKGGIILEVKVEPRSSKKEIAGTLGNALKVRLTAPPVGGAANEQLIELLSEHFGIRKNTIIILKGGTSKKKIIKLLDLSELPTPKQG